LTFSTSNCFTVCGNSIPEAGPLTGAADVPVVPKPSAPAIMAAASAVDFRIFIMLCHPLSAEPSPMKLTWFDNAAFDERQINQAL
jgi:hypothetical protein